MIPLRHLLVDLLASKNAKKTKAYLDALDKYFKDHKICTRINKLVDDAPSLARNQLKR